MIILVCFFLSSCSQQKPDIRWMILNGEVSTQKEAKKQFSLTSEQYKKEFLLEGYEASFEVNNFNLFWFFNLKNVSAADETYDNIIGNSLDIQEKEDNLFMLRSQLIFDQLNFDKVLTWAINHDSIKITDELKTQKAAIIIHYMHIFHTEPNESYNPDRSYLRKLVKYVSPPIEALKVAWSYQDYESFLIMLQAMDIEDKDELRTYAKIAYKETEKKLASQDIILIKLNKMFISKGIVDIANLENTIEKGDPYEVEKLLSTDPELLGDYRRSISKEGKKELLSKEINGFIVTRQRDGIDQLFFSLSDKKIEIFKHLLKYSPDLNDNELFILIEKSDEESLKAIIERFNLDQDFIDFALIDAISSENIDLIRNIIKAGGNIDRKDKNGETIYQKVDRLDDETIKEILFKIK